MVGTNIADVTSALVTNHVLRCNSARARAAAASAFERVRRRGYGLSARP
ncbi:MAG TPA: hypothetical protein VER11_10910 [Polyangiaceae bacterium]|nr:hypothetical protein [Polyangiaceae bacterium]